MGQNSDTPYAVHDAYRAYHETYRSAYERAVSGVPQVNRKLRAMANRRYKKFVVNRHTRRLAKEYYGLPGATTHVASKLVVWLKGDISTTMDKRVAFHTHTFEQWTREAAMYRLSEQIEFGPIMRDMTMRYNAFYRHSKAPLNFKELFNSGGV